MKEILLGIAYNTELLHNVTFATAVIALVAVTILVWRWPRKEVRKNEKSKA